MTDHRIIHKDPGHIPNHLEAHHHDHDHHIDHPTIAHQIDSLKTLHLVEIITQPLQNHQDNTTKMTPPLAIKLLQTNLTLGKTTLPPDKITTAVHHHHIDQAKIIDQAEIIILETTELRKELRHRIILNLQITTIDLTKLDHTLLKTIQKTTKDLQKTADQIHQPEDPTTPVIYPE